MTNFKLIYVIFCSTICLDACIVLVGVEKCARKIKNLLNWCADFYNIEGKYFGDLKNRKIELRRKIVKMLKWFQKGIYLEASLISVGFTVTKIFLPESILPRYALPLPLFLPFEDQCQTFAFWTTMSFQTLFLFTTAPLFIYFCGHFLCLILHIFAFLDLIKDAAHEMKKDLVKNPVDCVKILNDMICEVNSVVSEINKIFSDIFLNLEIGTLGTYFSSGLIILILREQYFYAICINIIGVCLLLCCYINEKILDKFENIQEAIYDLPWYELEVKHQKMFLILLNCDKINRGFTAGGFHSLSLERFTTICHSGYSNFLVLRDLVLKYK
ncbi:uncharacterized protein LOC134833736 [Culicoides brevitarsis]|uniref:uncharacterized protein LOC134833736 n=1 Tax=Culicoides brevitarsis TaxID=469753 RepID=UPI00307C393E